VAKKQYTKNGDYTIKTGKKGVQLAAQKIY